MWNMLFVLLAAPPAAPRWEFHDAAVYDGRSLLAFRAVELSDRPVRPLVNVERPAGKAYYSLLPVGTSPADFPALVWLPRIGEVWLDGDGDGRFSPAERHRFDGKPLEVAAVLRVGKPGAEPAQLKKTIVLRRAVDGGLRYAVRGYVTGTLRLGSQDYAALLSDGNADGCFDSAAHDRLWIDLDRDGRFDALTEQFPLGKPLTVGAKTYLVKPEPDGSGVHVRERPSERGTLRLALTSKPGAAARAVSLNLVSDWGELVTLTGANEAASLPVGRYSVDALKFQLADAKGRKWQYHFGSARRVNFEITSGTEKVVSLLSGLRLAVELNIGKEAVRPGNDVYVTPNMQTSAGLYLVNCERCERGNEDFTSGHADIRLANARGETLAREQSGFV